MSATTAMDINAEARRILAVSISKLYASRTQRGGLRLHRSLLLSMVMRSARDIYHSSRENEGTSGAHQAPEEPMDTGSNAAEQTEPAPHVEPQSEPCATEPINDKLDDEVNEDKENLSPSRHSRKRRGKTSVAPDFLPSKRARLEPGEERYATPVGSCRAADSLTALSLNRVIPAF
ncbi:immediate early response 2b [Takifugu flavidus]|nr:immediate early response 2b [Takifugu flavidus]TWW59044.1 Immediate early response gene 2 protein [Takifugu flavidus]